MENNVFRIMKKCFSLVVLLWVISALVWGCANRASKGYNPAVPTSFSFTNNYILKADAVGDDAPVLAAMFTTNNQGYLSAYSGDGQRWQIADGASMSWSNGWAPANLSPLRVAPRQFIMASFWGTNATAYDSVQTSFALWNSTNWVKWNFLGVHSPNIAGLKRLWAPELFRDDDGNVYCYFTASLVTNVSGPFNIYYVKALDTTWTNWSSAVQLTGLGSNPLDPFVVKDNSTYYMWYKDETTKYICVATSSSPTNGFTTIKTGNWTGTWGADLEAPSLARLPNGKWLILFDAYMDGTWMNYSTSTGLLSGWSPRLAVVSPEENSLRHGTVRTVPFGEVASMVADAQGGRYRNIEEGRTRLFATNEGFGQLQIYNTNLTDPNNLKAEIGLFPYGFDSRNTFHWLHSAQTNTYGLWTPDGFAFTYWRRVEPSGPHRLWTFYNNLTAKGDITATNISTLGGGMFTGNGAGLTNIGSVAAVANLTNGAYLADFGGRGDGRKLNGISVVSGVVTAPSGTFSSGDTGKLFLAYLDSTNLTSTLTTIASYSNSTTVTLANTGITTSSKDAIFGTDNTTALSNALVALRYSGGIIHIKKGVYLFGSSHRSASGANTTIRMPVVAYNAPTNETVTFAIVGEHQPPMTYWVNNNGVPWYGTVLMDVTTPVANQTNAFFEDFTTADVFSPIRTKFENLTIRSTPNPKRTALLWKRGGGLHVTDCTFDADISEGYIPNTLGEPIYYPPSAFGSTGTNNLPTNTFAIYGPEVYNSGDYRIRDTSISFWPNCIYAQEHTFIDNVNLTANTLGIYAQAGSSSSVSIGKIFFFCMQYPVYAAPLSLGAQNQRIYFDVKDFGIENHDDWPLPVPPGDGLGNFIGNSPITDVSNRLSGTIANLYGSAYVDLKAFSHPGLEVKNNFKSATYSVPENRIGSDRTLVVEGALASPLGAARKALLVDVPFSEGSGQYVRSYAPGFHVFGAAPGTAPATWLRDDQGGRPGVQMLPNTNSAYAMTYDWEETNYFTFNIIYSSTATNATNNLISPYYRQLHSSTNGLAYHTGFGRWIYYKNNMHDGVVRMVTATYGTNGCALYVNGVEVGRTNLAYPPGQHRMSLLFGTEFGGANLNAHRYQCWKGVLAPDEIKAVAMTEGLWNTTDGSSLTNFNASQLSTGTVPNARLQLPVEFLIAASDETTELTAGNGKTSFRAPFAFTITNTYADVNTAPSGSALVVGIKNEGTRIATNTIAIAGTGSTNSVFAPWTSIAKRSLLSVDIISTGTNASGLKVTFQGYRTP